MSDGFIIYNEYTSGCLYREVVWIGGQEYPLRTAEERIESVSKFWLISTSSPEVAIHAMVLAQHIVCARIAVDQARTILLQPPACENNPPKRSVTRGRSLWQHIRSFLGRSWLKGLFSHKHPMRPQL